LQLDVLRIFWFKFFTFIESFVLGPSGAVEGFNEGELLFLLFSFDIAAVESGVAPQNSAVLAKTTVGKSGKFGKDQLFSLNLSVSAFGGFLFSSLFLVLLLFGVLRSLLLVLIFLRLGLLS